jgi:heterodisulfide reductase subunit A-like polyferredoxin
MLPFGAQISFGSAGVWGLHSQDRVLACASADNACPMLAPSGYVARVDRDLCAACGVCAGFCPFGAISVDDDSAVVDAGVCMGCGVCVAKCAQEALSLAREPKKGEPLEIQKLIARAAGTTLD